MKFLFAPDSFKGTLSSIKIIEILEKKAKEHFPQCYVMGVPIADGGEGTVEAIVATAKGELKEVFVLNPLFEKISAIYGTISNETAVIEMASASGLTLIPYKEGNAMKTTTYGTGELIMDALENGFKDIIIAIGGSATNDGGIGAMSALGIKFIDENGNVLKPTGENLIKIKSIDVSELSPKVKEARFTVMCDVNNPLIGENGATYVYGKQKGAVGEYMESLELGMKNYERVVKEHLGIELGNMSGAGAAGGLGGALMAFLDAKLQSGIETVLDVIKFEELLQGVDIIVTGEGRIDYQSSCGKVLWGIGKYAKNKNIPVVAIAGGMGEGATAIYDCGINSIVPTVNSPMTLESALARAEELLEDAADRMFRLIKVGMDLKK